MENEETKIETKEVAETAPEELVEEKSSKKGFSIVTGIFNTFMAIMAAIFTPAIISILSSHPEVQAEGENAAASIAGGIIIALIEGIGRVLIIGILIAFILCSVLNFVLSLVGFLKNKKCYFLLAMLILSSILLALFIVLLICTFVI